ncbi:hypothetical protein PYCCODRAFT_1380319 [Trametes coccinea BRFM310]|uniref:RNA polymerase I-specific transcription initiation factor RRN6-like protein n=1 Tax=Trametes coccinea (strain BRFM310) TaxID=1353009 RepID=A0A1Y2J734_TRAC3|nr:hypothetical protein PYCCODRAFT_1380319 [Trametes coccinea BRFM310]
MDVWPGYSNEQATTSQKGKGKGKAKTERAENPWCYPILEDGSLGAATLKKRGARFEWTFASEGHSDYKLVAPDGPVEVFPPTRPRPWRGPKVTELQRAEQGAHFLRTFYPDIDIQAELIREEIAEDSRAAHKLGHDDPYVGNMVDVSSFHVSRKNMAYVVFPMGETNRQLNMSPLVVQPKAKVDVKPLATPVFTFDTPIQQIVASPHAVEVGKNKPVPTLGVRTMGSTTFLQIKLAVNKASFAVEPSPLVTVQRADIGDRHAVDIAISPVNPFVGYIVNDAGQVYRCSAPEGRKLIEQVHACDFTTRSLYRIAVSEARQMVLTVSETYASLVDLRAGKRAHQLHSVNQPDVVLTSVESIGDDRMIRLVSSDEILWIDERNSRRPLLAIKHGREFDTTLRSFTRTMISSPLTFLTSRRNSLVTVYDVSRASDNLVYMHEPPHALSPVLHPDGPHLGYAFYQQPTLAGSKHLSIFQLSNRGSMSLLNLQRVHNDTAPETPTARRTRGDWSEAVKKLGDEAEAARPDLGPVAGKAHIVVDLQYAYQKLFVDRKEPDLAAESEAVYDTLERVPSFWQDTDVPVEHGLTMFDIAMRSGPEPVDASRNDWFTGSALDCAAGHRALVQGQIPREQLVRSTPWHLDISPLVRRTIPELKRDPQGTLECLTRYDLADGPDRTAASYRRENEARSQVALDLSLACDVLVPKRPGQNPISTFDEDMLNISRSTEAMSLAELEPPPVNFGFLRPIPKEDANGQPIVPEDSTDPTKSVVPLGVRLLLQEWDVGTNPYEYVYRDPYDDTAEPPARTQRPMKPFTPAQKEAQSSMEMGVAGQNQMQRPPAIASSTPRAPPAIAASQPVVPRKPLVAARSHDVLVPPSSPRVLPSGTQKGRSTPFPPPSQDLMASTQVLPGPHGGRPAPAKKKPVKKRLGGF